MPIKFNLVALLVLLTGCKTIPVIFPSAYKVLVSNGVLVYDGPITGGAVLEAIRVVRESGEPINTLKITSPGGDVAAGIEFGYFVKENNLNVEVSELCFSACANYVLPAAKKVVINRNSLIGWHGGATDPNDVLLAGVPQAQRAQAMAYIHRLRMKETAFFGYIGVDQQITTYGDTIAGSCKSKQRTDGWYYSIEDMQRMGIDNIEIKGNELLSSLEYKQDSGQMDTTSFYGDTITACLLENVFAVQ